MNKYALLILINLPLIIFGVLSSITSYKTRRISRRKSTIQIFLWLMLGLALLLVEPIYNLLIRSQLTDSAPLSLFDIVLLSMMLFFLFLLKRANEKITWLNHKVARMHENLAIAEEERHWDKRN